MTRSSRIRLLAAIAVTATPLAACAPRAWQPASAEPSALTQAQYECERDNRLAGFIGTNTSFYRHCMAAHGWEPQP